MSDARHPPMALATPPTDTDDQGATDQRPPYTLLRGDMREVLRTLPAESIDAVVTDPPYGLGEVRSLKGLLTAWLEELDDRNFYGSGGFMGASWDAGVPGPSYWREVYRVMKPGAHLVAFGGTRTYDLLVIALRLAGFEIRDQLSWLYGSGMPKSMAIDKAIDRHLGVKRTVLSEYVKQSGDITGGNFKRAPGEGYPPKLMQVTAPATPEAEAWLGWGTGLKPAQEPICLARKPPAEPTVAAQVLATGTGAINIDATRVEHTPTAEGGWGTYNRANSRRLYGGFTTDEAGDVPTSTRNELGRWSPNVLLSHTPDCVQVGTAVVRGHASDYDTTPSNQDNPTHVTDNIRSGVHYGDEVIDQWECAPGCAVQALGEQSGVSQSSANERHSSTMGYHGNAQDFTTGGHADEGTAARFYPQLNPDPDQDGWRCAPGCAVAALGEQSGIGRSGVHVPGVPRANREGYAGPMPEIGSAVYHDDEGTAARFYPQFPLEPHYDEPFYYCAKASRAERNAGCDGLPLRAAGVHDDDNYREPGERKANHTAARPTRNHHPTVKPVALMRWLVRLVCPPGGVMLDPFAGSCTSGVAAVLEGVQPILVELDADGTYIPIGHARLAYAVQQREAGEASKPTSRSKGKAAASKPQAKPEHTARCVHLEAIGAWACATDCPVTFAWLNTTAAGVATAQGMGLGTSEVRPVPTPTPRKRPTAGEVPNRPARARRATAATPQGPGLWDSSEV